MGINQIPPYGFLDRLAPLHLVLDAKGRVVSHGPTVARLFAGRPLQGAEFTRLFESRGQVLVESLADFPHIAGHRLRLVLRGEDMPLRLRGVILPMGQGWLVNLSFGIDITRAVALLQLNDADFAPTDLAMELLYLAEANAAVTGELGALAQRLDRARRQAREEAETDPLTGLRNRRACESQLARLCREGEPFALMHIDLDHFKAVNDRFGHAAGDHVLAHVAEVMKSGCRAGDSLARVGGDEFVLLLPGMEDARTVLNLGLRMVARLSRPIPWQDHSCEISASIGFVLVEPGARAQPIRVLAEADDALYAAKKAGRARVKQAREPPHAA